MFSLSLPPPPPPPSPSSPTMEVEELPLSNGVFELMTVGKFDLFGQMTKFGFTPLPSSKKRDEQMLSQFISPQA